MVDIGAVTFVSAIVIRRGPNTINAKESYEKYTRGRKLTSYERKKEGIDIYEAPKGARGDATRRDQARFTLDRVITSPFLQTSAISPTPFHPRQNWE